MKQIYVCNGQKCRDIGSGRVMAALEKFFGLKQGEKNDTVFLQYCQCLSFCERGPNVQVDRNLVFGARPETIAEEVQKGGVSKPDGIIHTIDIDTDII